MLIGGRAMSIIAICLTITLCLILEIADHNKCIMMAAVIILIIEFVVEVISISTVLVSLHS